MVLINNSNRNLFSVKGRFLFNYVQLNVDRKWAAAAACVAERMTSLAPVCLFILRRRSARSTDPRVPRVQWVQWVPGSGLIGTRTMADPGPEAAAEGDDPPSTTPPPLITVSGLPSATAAGNPEDMSHQSSRDICNICSICTSVPCVCVCVCVVQVLLVLWGPSSVYTLTLRGLVFLTGTKSKSL